MSHGDARLTVLLPAELAVELARVVPLGYRKWLLVALVKAVLQLIERDGERALLAIINEEFELVHRK